MGGQELNTVHNAVPSRGAAVTGVLSIIALYGCTGLAIAQTAAPQVLQASQTQAGSAGKNSAAHAAAEARQLAGWKTYDNGRLRFRYPPTLSVSSAGGAVSLNQWVRYPNSGDCDMDVSDKGYDKLQVFGLNFRFVTKADVSENADTPVRIGRWQGTTNYNGIEGCGQHDYYLALGDGRVLLVEYAAVQALSGISTGWDRAEIMRLPGAVSRETSQRWFDLIMGTLEVRAAKAASR